MRLDEKIALLEKEIRIGDEREEKIKKEDGELDIDWEYSIEKFRREINRGRVILGIQFLKTERRTILENQLEIPFLPKIFEIVEEKDDIAWYGNEPDGINLNFNLVKIKEKRTTLKEWQTFLQNGMLELKLHADVKKVEALEHLDYMCYEVPTAKGVFYNVAFRLIEDNQYFIGIFNCPKDKSYSMGVLFEAMVYEINDYRNS